MFVGVEAPWRALQSHFVNLKDIWEGALSQFIHCRVIQRALSHQHSNKKEMPQKTLILIRVAKFRLPRKSSLLKVKFAALTIQRLRFICNSQTGKKNYSSDLLINLCRCGTSACNCDWWDFSLWFLMAPCKSTNSLEWTVLITFRTLGNVHRPPTCWDGLGNWERATLWATVQKLFHQIRYNFITVYTPGATTWFKIQKNRKKNSTCIEATAG